MEKNNFSEMFGQFSQEALLADMLTLLQKIDSKLGILINNKNTSTVTMESPIPEDDTAIFDLPAMEEPQPQPAPVEPAKPEKAEQEPQPQPAEQHTHEDIRALLRSLTVSSLKEKGKQVIKDAGCSKVSDIPSDMLEEVYTSLKELKESVENGTAA